MCTIQEAQAKSDEEIKDLSPTDLVDAHFLTWDGMEDKLMGPKLKMMCVSGNAGLLLGCVVYSFGSNGDTSFEEDVLRKTACEVHTFDPTLDPEQEAQVLAVPGINLHKIGLAAEPGEVR